MEKKITGHHATQQTIPTAVKMADIILDNSVTKTFVNGFQIGLTTADAHIIGKYDNAPVMVMIMGLPALKTLHKQLGQLLEVYEKKLALPLLDNDEMAQKMNELTNI